MLLTNSQDIKTNMTVYVHVRACVFKHTYLVVLHFQLDYKPQQYFELISICKV